MASTAAKAASKIGSSLAGAKGGAKAAQNEAGKSSLNRGARRDPELYILAAIMTGAFSLAGFYFGRKPTSANSEAKVAVKDGSMPWQTEGSGEGKDSDEHSKYQYHPGGDLSRAPKDAPSALHTVIVPNVNLPKELHDQFNKWGKDGY